MENLFQYRNQKWVIAVSGGPDSMALLDLAFKSNLDIYVLHVNYHKRESALRDQMIVQEYCVKNNIPCFVYDSPDFKGNFQDNARIFRYTKIKELVNQVSAQGVLVAHHKDDDLETLIFQIKRNSKVAYYGLSHSTHIFGIRVDRPLLSYTKKELVDYCHNNSINYGIDESNHSLVYTRNKIRFELNELKPNEIDELYKIKNEYNQKRDSFIQTFDKLLNQTSISHNIYISLSHNRNWFLLEWLRYQTDVKALSDKFILELDRQLVNAKSVKLRLSKQYRLIKQYDMIQIIEEMEDYKYRVNINQTLDERIKLSYEKKSGYTKVQISKDSFPLTITNLRSCRNSLQSNIYTKLSRWFIKNKIPIQDREMWPLVFNHKNELIYILDVGYEHGVSTDTMDCYMLK